MCSSNHSEAAITTIPRIVTADLTALRSAVPSRPAAFAASAPALEQIHALPSGDMLLSAAVAGPQEGTVVLHGSIGPFPYEVEITVRLDDNGRVTVALHIRKPIDLGPYEWTFNLTGIVRDASGRRIIAADGLVAASTPTAARLDWWCVLRCGGTSILGVLLECLPALVGGVQAYIACVVGKLGASAAKIAECIAVKCK